MLHKRFCRAPEQSMAKLFQNTWYGGTCGNHVTAYILTFVVPHSSDGGQKASSSLSHVLNSGYIREMTHSGLVVPGRHLTLQQTVGKGAQFDLYWTYACI